MPTKNQEGGKKIKKHPNFLGCFYKNVYLCSGCYSPSEEGKITFIKKKRFVS